MARIAKTVEPEIQEAPVVENAADSQTGPSICNFNISISFDNKEQIQDFINKYMTWASYPCDFDYELKVGDSFTPDIHTVTIKNSSWGSNLVAIGQILEDIDYKG